MKVEVGNYALPEQVGWNGLVTFEKYIAFEKLDGEVVVIKKPD